MNAPTTVFPPPRVAPHLAHAWGGVWRLTYRRFVTPGQLLLTAGLLAGFTFVMWAIVRTGRASSFADWTLLFYFSQALPILSFLLGAGAIRDEMKSSAIDYTLTRPVPRFAFVGFKFGALLICLQLALLLGLGALFGMGTLKAIPELAGAIPAVLLGQVITITAFLAIGFLCGVLTRRYIFLGLAWGAIFELGAGNLPSALSRLSVTHQVREMVASHLPRAPTDLVPASETLISLAILLIMAAAMLALAAFLFSRRELAGAKDA